MALISDPETETKEAGGEGYHPVIQRINFIEKDTLDFTYRRLLAIGVVLLSLCLLFNGVQRFRIFLMEKKIPQLSEEVTALKEEQEKIRKATAARDTIPVSARAAIIQQFVNQPLWSSLLREMTSRTPSSLWLSSFKSYEKPDSPSKRGILLSGQSDQAGSVAHFLKALSDSPAFEKVVLTSLTLDKSPLGIRYQLAIDLDVSSREEGAGP